MMRITPAEGKKLDVIKRLFTSYRHEPKWFLVASGAKLIDASKRGNELYGIDTMIHGRTLKILQYRDPSTNQLYISFVPEEIKKADDGMAWKFRMSRKEYDRLRAEA